MPRHISDQILVDVAFDPAKPLANLADAKARVKKRYVITQPQLEELVDGFEKMARAYKNKIYSELAEKNGRKPTTTRRPAKKKTKR